MNLERGVKVGIKLKPGTFPKHISRVRKGGNRVSNAVHKGLSGRNKKGGKNSLTDVQTTFKLYPSLVKANTIQPSFVIKDQCLVINERESCVFRHAAEIVERRDFEKFDMQ